MSRDEVKQKIGPKVEAFLEKVLEDAKDSNITADEIPELVDAGVAAGLVILKSVQDKRITFAEMLEIIRACQTLAQKWQAAKKD